MPARGRGEALKAVRDLADLGPALPHNMGSTRAIPEEIAKVMADAVLTDRLCTYLVRQFIQESGMAGPEGGEVQIELHIRPELRIVGSTLDGLTEKAATNGHGKRS